MKKLFNSTNLKLIAITSMFIDHFASYFYWSNSRFYLESTYNINFEPTYIILRMIGRIAFPIFAFLIAQGYFYTHDIKKYLKRLFIFAIISEVPFDLILSRSFFNIAHQNIFFTLALGLLAIYYFNYFKNQDKKIMAYTSLIIILGLSLAFMTDYNFIGVLMIFFFHYFRENKRKAIIGFVIINTLMVLYEIGMMIYDDYAFPIQLAGFIPLFFIINYNHQKGRNLKYLFYVFYPAHLVLLYILDILINIILNI